jgi:hypothetical protein
MLLSHSLDKFKVIGTSPFAVNCRCPLCGDSAKNKNKARGYFFRTSDGTTRYKCHNCSASHTLRSFLKTFDHSLYKEYAAEVFKESGQKRDEPTPVQRTKAFEVAEKHVTALSHLPTIKELPKEHPARVYWESRMIPWERAGDVYWTGEFLSWVNKYVIEDKFENVKVDHGRIIFPFKNKNSLITGYTARSIDGQEPKYIAIKVVDQMGGFGMNRLDYGRRVKVVEGPIDSMFLDNACAMGTSNKILDIDDKVMIYDNEPRSPQLVAIMRKTIDAGENIVIWPKSLTEKDINEMKLAGHDPEAIIAERTFRGMRASIELAAWVV